MKTALVTTTINVPTVLKLYRACGPDVVMFVAGDKKTPVEARHFCDSMDFVHLDDVDRSNELDYACSDLIGWNTVARRNIAILEALKWGADIIVSIDDDNIPLGSGYFPQFTNRLVCDFVNSDQHGHLSISPFPILFDGLMATGVETGAKWFDAGLLLDPPAPHRGQPRQNTPSDWRVVPAVDIKIGVAAGICLGDPDIDAVERIANQPIVHGVSELLRAGLVVDNNTWTVFNSQNTAYLRELAPAMLLCPQFGRHDDIFASLVAQRVMRERNLHVHFGQPFVWQQRNPHDLIQDLKSEIFGMEHILRFAELLDGMALHGKSVLEDVYTIWEIARSADWMPEGIVQLSRAWIKDCEKVL